MAFEPGHEPDRSGRSQTSRGGAVSIRDVCFGIMIIAGCLVYFKSSKSNATGPLIPPAAKPDLNGPVQGQMLYDGRPITEFTQAYPTFWIRNEEAGKEAKGRVVFEGSRFAVTGLSPGSYGVQVTFDANTGNSVNSPGDYYSWTPFKLGKDGRAKIQVELSRVIHLLKPVNNNEVLPGWAEEGCEPGATLPQEITFRWESVAKGAVYSYAIRTVACPYRDLGVAASGTTTETTLNITLPASSANQFYLMTLYATRENRQIGILMTWGPNFLAWDYRFRVKP